MGFLILKMTEKKSEYQAESIQVLKDLKTVRNTYNINWLVNQSTKWGSKKLIDIIIAFVPLYMEYKIGDSNGG